MRSYGWESILGDVMRDVKYSLRRLRRTPGFTLVSIGTLALGLGATSAIFCVINGVLLKPLPYPHPEQLVAVRMTAPGVKIADLNMAPSVYFTMCDEERAFQAVSIFATGRTTVDKTHPEEVQAVFASHELLPILGLKPQLGRLFGAADDDPKGTRTAMLSDGYWRSHFGGDRSVLGRQILVEGNAVSIIGVLPPSFEFMDEHPDLLIPMRFDRAKTNLGVFSYRGLARIKDRPNVESGRMRISLACCCGLRTVSSFGWLYGQECLKMLVLHRICGRSMTSLIGEIGSTAMLLISNVGIDLLIACANVANLLLVRTDARQQELAVRAALGAAVTRIARELLVESILLGAIAGAVGLALCQAALKLLSASNLVHLPRAENIRIDGWVLLFTLVVSIGVSALFGLIPVLRYLRPRLENALRSGGRSLNDSKDRQRVRGFLVVFQVGLALLLLIICGSHDPHLPQPAQCRSRIQERAGD